MLQTGLGLLNRNDMLGRLDSLVSLGQQGQAATLPFGYGRDFVDARYDPASGLVHFGNGALIPLSDLLDRLHVRPEELRSPALSTLASVRNGPQAQTGLGNLQPAFSPADIPLGPSLPPTPIGAGQNLPPPVATASSAFNPVLQGRTYHFAIHERRENGERAFSVSYDIRNPDGTTTPHHYRLRATTPEAATSEVGQALSDGRVPGLEGAAKLDSWRYTTASGVPTAILRRGSDFQVMLPGIQRPFDLRATTLEGAKAELEEVFRRRDWQYTSQGVITALSAIGNDYFAHVGGRLIELEATDKSSAESELDQVLRQNTRQWDYTPVPGGPTTRISAYADDFFVSVNGRTYDLAATTREGAVTEINEAIGPREPQPQPQTTPEAPAPHPQPEASNSFLPETPLAPETTELSYDPPAELLPPGSVGSTGTTPTSIAAAPPRTNEQFGDAVKRLLPSRETAAPGQVTQEDWDEYAERHPDIVTIVREAGHDASDADRAEAARALVNGAYGIDVVAWLRAGGAGSDRVPPNNRPPGAVATRDPDPDEARRMAEVINQMTPQQLAGLPDEVKRALGDYMLAALATGSPSATESRVFITEAIGRLGRILTEGQLPYDSVNPRTQVATPRNTQALPIARADGELLLDPSVMQEAAEFLSRENRETYATPEAAREALMKSGRAGGQLFIQRDETTGQIIGTATLTPTGPNEFYLGQVAAMKTDPGKGGGRDVMSRLLDNMRAYAQETGQPVRIHAYTNKPENIYTPDGRPGFYAGLGAEVNDPNPLGGQDMTTRRRIDFQWIFNPDGSNGHNPGVHTGPRPDASGGLPVSTADGPRPVSPSSAVDVTIDRSGATARVTVNETLNSDLTGQFDFGITNPQAQVSTPGQASTPQPLSPEEAGRQHLVDAPGYRPDANFSRAMEGATFDAAQAIQRGEVTNLPDLWNRLTEARYQYELSQNPGAISDAVLQHGISRGTDYNATGQRPFGSWADPQFRPYRTYEGENHGPFTQGVIGNTQGLIGSDPNAADLFTNNGPPTTVTHSVTINGQTYNLFDFETAPDSAATNRMMTRYPDANGARAMMGAAGEMYDLAMSGTLNREDTVEALMRMYYRLNSLSNLRGNAAVAYAALRSAGEAVGIEFPPTASGVILDQRAMTSMSEDQFVRDARGYFNGQIEFR